MTAVEPGARKCFVISPIGAEGSEVRSRSDQVKQFIIERALVPTYVASVVRADEDFNPGEITPAIITAILEADIVVADLTGANPNVYYELAIAHAYRKPTIHIRLAGELLPFDIKDVRVFEYGIDLASGEKAKQAIEQAAAELLVRGTTARTPVSGARAIQEAAESGEAGDQIAIELLTRLDGIERAIERLTQAAGPTNPTDRRTELQKLGGRLMESRMRFSAASVDLDRAIAARDAALASTPEQRALPDMPDPRVLDEAVEASRARYEAAREEARLIETQLKGLDYLVRHGVVREDLT